MMRNGIGWKAGAWVLLTAWVSVAGGQVIFLDTFETYEVFQQDPLLRHPHFSGSTSFNVSTNQPPTPPYVTRVSEQFANDRMDPCVALPGSKSQHTYWVFTDASLEGETPPWVRLTTFNANGTPNPVIDISQGLGFFILAPDDEFYIHIGVREVITEEPIGGNGGIAGGIEFVGVTNEDGYVRGTRLIRPSPHWQYVYFDLPNEPVLPFAGVPEPDGILFTENNKAVLEHVGIRYSPDSPGGARIDLWIDDVHVGDPITPLAVPLEMRITAIERVVGGNLEMAFTTLYPGRDHVIQEKTDALSSDWSDVAGVTLGTPVCNVFFTAQFPDPGAPRRVYRVAAFPAQPIFFDDFEGPDQGWTHGGAGDNWAVGTPTAGPGAAYSPVNCWATGLSDPYPANAAMWLRSPAIDLTGVAAATLTFWEFHQTDPGFHYVTLYAKDAADPGGTPLATLFSATGASAAWAEVSLGLVSPVLGSNIVLEFVLTSDSDVSYGGQGWFIDDVSVIPE